MSGDRSTLSQQIVDPLKLVLPDLDEPANPGKRTVGSNLYGLRISPSPSSPRLRFAIAKLPCRHVFALLRVRHGFSNISRSHSTHSRNPRARRTAFPSRIPVFLLHTTSILYRHSAKHMQSDFCLYAKINLLSTAKVTCDPLNRDAREKIIHLLFICLFLQKPRA